MYLFIFHNFGILPCISLMIQSFSFLFIVIKVIAENFCSFLRFIELLLAFNSTFFVISDSREIFIFAPKFCSYLRNVAKHFVGFNPSVKTSSGALLLYLFVFRVICIFSWLLRCLFFELKYSAISLYILEENIYRQYTSIIKMSFVCKFFN